MSEPQPKRALSPAEVACLEQVLQPALAEDGVDSDLTVRALRTACGALPPARGQILARAEGVVAGLACAQAAYTLAATTSDLEGFALAPRAQDGDSVRDGQVLLEVRGAPALLLARERVFLNLLGHLSGVATATRRLVDAVAGTGCRVLHTRKTTPGLRALELYAVRCGGGASHRAGLHDGVMLKENHFACVPDGSYAGIVAAVTAAARAQASVATPPGQRPHEIVAEAENLDDALAAAAAGVDVVMLDDFPLSTIADAIARLRAAPRPGGLRPVEVEVSGGVTVGNAGQFAATGCDRISSGAITHSVAQLDVSFRIVP